MEWYYILLIVLVSLIVLFLLANILLGYVGYKNAFKKIDVRDAYTIPKKSFYYPFKEEFIRGIEWYNTIKKEDIYITNNRNLKLRGRLTKQSIKEKPTVIIFFHGWNSIGDNDINCFGVPLLYKEGYDLLIIDQVAHGKSEGNMSTVGILEQEDVLLWVDKVNEIYNDNCNIVLSGMSMGANMVMLSANKPMKNVKAIIENCGFTNAYDELKYISTSKYKIPGFTFSFVSMMIKLNTGLCLKKFDARHNLKESLYPVLFIHGKIDQTVPYQMAIDLYNSCGKDKEILLVEDAIHLVAGIVDVESFNNITLSFLNKHLKDS